MPLEPRQLRRLANERLWPIWTALKQALGAGSDAEVGELLQGKYEVFSVHKPGSIAANSGPMRAMGFDSYKDAAQAYADAAGAWLDQYRHVAGRDPQLDEEAAQYGRRFTIVANKGYTVGALTVGQELLAVGADVRDQVKDFYDRWKVPAMILAALVLVLIVARR